MKKKLVLAVLLVALVSVSTEVARAAEQAIVHFVLRGLTVNGASQGSTPDRYAATVQRTQWLVFTLGGGRTPWSMVPASAGVKVEKLSDNQFKVTPLQLGTTALAITDSTGGGKWCDVTVIEDRYGAEAQVFNNNNGQQIQNSASSPQFNLQVGHKITLIQTYHYNQGRGKAPGTIALKNADGRVYGPWQATQLSTVYWVVKPGAQVAPGNYTVIDSDPATWSGNAASRGGFAIIKGQPRL